MKPNAITQYVKGHVDEVRGEIASKLAANWWIAKLVAHQDEPCPRDAPNRRRMAQKTRYVCSNNNYYY